MMKFKIRETLLATGKTRPNTWLMKFCGFGQGKAHNILNNKQKSVSLHDLGVLCTNLGCTPNDLFYWENTPRLRLPEDHPLLTQLSPPSKTGNWERVFKALSPQEVHTLYKQAEDIMAKK